MGFLLEDVQTYVEDYLREHGRTLSNLQSEDDSLNEVLLFDDVEGNVLYLWDVGVFSELADDLGYERCWTHPDPSKKKERLLTRGCVKPTEIEGGYSIDIFVRRGAAESPLNLPGTVRFNTCFANSPKDEHLIYATLVHEFGHAIGIHSGKAHPTVADSVMNYDFTLHKVYTEISSIKDDPMNGGVNFDEPDCSPHPFDIMAVYAIYQTLE